MEGLSPYYSLYCMYLASRLPSLIAAAEIIASATVTPHTV